MDLYVLFEEPLIKEYLEEFPKKLWIDTVKKTLIYGIKSLKALESLGLSRRKTEKIPVLKLDSKKGPEDFNGQPENLSYSNISKPNKSTSYKNIKNSSRSKSNRHSSHNKLTLKNQKTNETYPAKKLIGREISSHREKTRTDHRNNFEPFQIKKLDLNSKKKNIYVDENSSLSTFNPTEDAQKIFKLDFSKFLSENRIPKKLHPVEIKPDHNRNLSSTSARVLYDPDEIYS